MVEDEQLRGRSLLCESRQAFAAPGEQRASADEANFVGGPGGRGRTSTLIGRSRYWAATHCMGADPQRRGQRAAWTQFSRVPWSTSATRGEQQPSDDEAHCRRPRRALTLFGRSRLKMASFCDEGEQPPLDDKAPLSAAPEGVAELHHHGGRTPHPPKGRSRTRGQRSDWRWTPGVHHHGGGPPTSSAWSCVDVMFPHAMTSFRDRGRATTFQR